MLLLRFFASESTQSLRKLLVMSFCAGLGNIMILALINVSAEQAWNQELSFRLFVLYIIAITVFIYSKKFACTETTIVVEQVLAKVRTRIADKLRSADLLFIERLGQPRVFTSLTQDTNLISQSAMVLINACASGILVIASLFYIGYLSMSALLLTLCCIAFGVSLYLYHRREMVQELNEAMTCEHEFFEGLQHLLNGFKQIKLNQRKSDDVYANLKQLTDRTEAVKIRTGIRSTVDYMFSQVFYYTLIAFIIFILPSLTPDISPKVMKLTCAVLFIMGPLDMVVGSLQMFAHATLAIRKIQNLEAEIDRVSAGTVHSVSNPERFKDFPSIAFDQLAFTYSEGSELSGFSVGPLDFRVKRGEIVYIIGGNGSGKSTLLKLLTGLYHPKSGSVLVGDSLLQKSDFNDFRELFSIVFTDFHLFDRLYGVQGVDENRVRELIRLMQLERKTNFVDGKFTNKDLSTGQRKRLALIAAFLDEKPILVFDEVAADQDPEFKRFFYEELLQDLRKQGKTILAVTHDDRYFHTADRVVKMDFGKLVEGFNLG